MDNRPGARAMFTTPPERCLLLENFVEETMSHKPRLQRIGRYALTFAIPISILVSSAIFPLQPFVRQALIGILFIWFQISLMLGLFPS